MENAVDALMIAFGVLIFVIALAMAFTLFSQARATSEIVLDASDKTSSQTYTEPLRDASGKAITKRIVGIETVIGTVRRYVTDNENYSVEIQDKTGRVVKTFDLIEDSSNNLTPTVTGQNLENNLEDLVKNYKTKEFEETFSSEIYRGGVFVDSVTGETARYGATEVDSTTGDTKQINTDTKVKITYKMTN